MMPTAQEARQLCRLRALRVQRAEERRNEAAAAVEQALAAVRSRQAAIEATRRRMEALAETLANELAATRPRWQDLAAAERALLVERLEGDESALIEDERKLEEANARLHEAKVELARARAREDVVRDLAAEASRHRARERDRRAELEIEDRPTRVPA
jgi:hypothetical protein